METKAAPLSTDLHKLPSPSPASSDQATGQAGQQNRALPSRFAKGCWPSLTCPYWVLTLKVCPHSTGACQLQGISSVKSSALWPSPALLSIIFNSLFKVFCLFPSSLSDTCFVVVALFSGFFFCYWAYTKYFVSFRVISTDLEPLFYVAAWQQTEVILGAKRASCPEQWGQRAVAQPPAFMHFGQDSFFFCPVTGQICT